MKTYLAIAFLAIFVSCKNDSQSIRIIQGTYKGFFQRTSSTNVYLPVAVTITLTADAFSGKADTQNEPGICSGVYSISGNIIQFSNLCDFTPDIDHTMVLYGNFETTVNGKTITLTKRFDTPAGQYDTYTLTLQ